MPGRAAPGCVQIQLHITDPGGRVDVDILVTGVEASLWIGEQFASDLQTLFPSLRVVSAPAAQSIYRHAGFKGTS